MSLIFDIGFHKGEDAIHYLKKGYRVIGIEANPLLVKEATIKFAKAIASKQLQLVNIGIAEEERILPFYCNQHLSEWSSFNKDLGYRMNTTATVIDVATKRLSSLFDEYGVPYYLKIDIEGYDAICLETLVGYIAYPVYISCEASSPKCIDLLLDMGYTHFKLINQFRNFKQLDLVWEKNKALTYWQNKRNRLKLRLQHYLPFKHSFGSSGPFGEETDGDWLTAGQVKDLYFQYYDVVTGNGLNKFSWFDIHAKK
jgi:FkbM family methyltransferase